MNFVVIGESVKRISDGLKFSHPQIEWKKIAAFRNIIAHNYFGVDADEIWDIVQNHVSILKKTSGQFCLSLVYASASASRFDTSPALVHTIKCEPFSITKSALVYFSGRILSALP